MTTPSPRFSGLSLLLAMATCLVATVSYVGAVAGSALVVLMLPAVLVTGLVGASNRDKTLTGVVASVVVGGVAAEVINILSGSYQGPVARGTFVAAICAGLAIVLTRSKYPSLFLLPVAGIVTGALALGAGGRVQAVSLVTAGIALVALSAVERDRRAMVTPARMAAPVSLALLLIIAAGVLATLLQYRFDSLPVRSPFEATFRKTIHTSSVFSLGSSAKQPADEPGGQVASNAGVSPPAKPVTGVPNPQHATPRGRPTAKRSTPVTSSTAGAGSHAQKASHHRASWLWLLVLLPLVLMVALAGRLLWSWWAWRRLYRRIRLRSAPPQAAWLWTVAHLRRVDMTLPPHSSPDVVAAGDVNGLKPAVQEPVRELARVVAPAVYAVVPGSVEPEHFWGLARVAADQAWTSSTRLRRAHARWRLPQR